MGSLPIELCFTGITGEAETSADYKIVEPCDKGRRR
jgi:hypothetical protein